MKPTPPPIPDCQSDNTVFYKGQPSCSREGKYPGPVPPHIPGLHNPDTPTGREGKARLGYIGGLICCSAAVILFFLSGFGYANYQSCHEILYATLPLGIMVAAAAGLNLIPVIMGMRSALKRKSRIGLILAIAAMAICMTAIIISIAGLAAHEAYADSFRYNNYYYY